MKWKIQIHDGGWYDLRLNDGDDEYHVELFNEYVHAQNEAKDHADSVANGCDGEAPVWRIVPENTQEEWSPYT